MKGHEPVIFDRLRIWGQDTQRHPLHQDPQGVFEHELRRVENRVTRVRVEGDGVTEELFMDIRQRYEYTVIAVGADNPRELRIRDTTGLFPPWISCGARRKTRMTWETRWSS
jgi:hypothetical protein